MKIKTPIILLITAGILFLSCTKSPAGRPTDTDPPPTATPGLKNQLVFGASGNGNLYAIDAQDGTIKWTFELNNAGYWTNMISSPAYYDSIIYVGSSDQNIYAVNAFTGKEVWRYHTNSTYGFYYSSPVVANGTVYVPGYEPKFYALDAKTGQLKWSRDFPRDFVSSPTYYNNTIFITSLDGVLNAIDAGTGDQIWSTGGGSVDYSQNSPCVKDGVLYAIADVDNLNINNVVMSELSAADGTGYHGVYAAFYFPPDVHFYSCPTIDDSIVYVGGSDSLLYAVKNGDLMYFNLMWKFKAGGIIAGSPAYDDSLVYTTTFNGVVYAVDKRTGIQKWIFDTYLGDNGIQTSPVVANGVVFFGSTDRFWALNAETGKLMWETNPPMPFFASPVVLGNDGKAYHAGISGMQN